MSAAKKLAIIDGKSIFYRGYWAMPNLSTQDGVPTGGVYGFCALSFELIRKFPPDYVCVAWDKPKTNIRKRLKIYPEYKAGRKPPPEDFYTQIPILERVLKALSWPLYQFDDYEADDIMHTLAKKADRAGLETILITSDLDALQSVSQTTHLYALKKGFTNIQKFDPAEFQKKYQIKVEQFLDLKALKGDSSDNIPGVSGIGEKTAASLLKEYGSLDNVYENLPLIKSAWAKKLEAGREMAYTSKKLAQLMDDAPVDLDLPAMRVEDLDGGELVNILQELEFRSLLQNLPPVIQKTVDRSGGDQILATKAIELHLPQVVIVEESTKIRLSGEVVLETRCAGAHGKKPTYFLLADAENCYVFDFRNTSKQRAESLISQIKTALKDVDAVIGHDLKKSFQALLELKINLPKVAHDTLIGLFATNTLARRQSLSQQALDLLGLESDLDNLDDSQFLAKAAEITALIQQLAEHQTKIIQKNPQIREMFEKIDLPIIAVLANIEYAGMKIDRKFFAELSDKIQDTIIQAEQTIYGYADRQFNISSPSQLSEVLFEDLGLPKSYSKKGRSGHYSTAVKVLNKLQNLHPIIAAIELYRTASKLKNTYIDALPPVADSEGRIHSTLNLTVVATGRLSSADPNLQNIPIRTELGREIRRGFCAERGNVLISADYSQFELRIAAALSGDSGMIQAFANDRDIHTETAALINGLPPEQVAKEMRYAAKAVNFGILYGQGVHGLSEGTGMDYLQAKQFIDKYFEVRPALKKMIDGFRDQAKNQGYVQTVIGRRRPTPDVKSSNVVTREAAYRAAVNMPIQGSAADLTKMAMIQVYDYLSSLRLKNDSFWPRQIMQVHDSIIVECPEEQAKQVAAKIEQIMQNIKPDLGVKLKVDVQIGKRWSEL